MGHITAPFGVQGWVKIQADTETPDSLLAYPELYMGKDGNWRLIKVLDIEPRLKGTLVARLDGVADREKAFALRGSLLAVPRESLPAEDDDEFYWADLIGMAVSGVDGVDLGTVDNLMSTGANDVLIVKGPDGVERLIPFVEAFVVEVDKTARRISTLWGLDY